MISDTYPISRFADFDSFDWNAGGVRAGIYVMFLV